MNTHPFAHDPAALLGAGIHTMPQAVVFVHIGRCGINGTTIPQICNSLEMPYNSVRSNIDHLEERKLVTPYGRQRRQGGARLWVVTKRGWSVLTTPADTGMFPDSMLTPPANRIANA